MIFQILTKIDSAKQKSVIWPPFWNGTTFSFSFFFFFFFLQNCDFLYEIYILGREFRKKSIKIVRFWVHSCMFVRMYVCLMVCCLFVFCPNFILTRVKIPWDKNHQKFCEAFYMHVSTECCLTFLAKVFIIRNQSKKQKQTNKIKNKQTNKQTKWTKHSLDIWF